MSIEKTSWKITDIKGADVPSNLWLVDPNDPLKVRFSTAEPGYYKTALDVTVDGEVISASVESVYLGVPLSLNVTVSAQSDLDTALSTLLATSHKHLNIYLSGTAELDFSALAKSNTQWDGNTVSVFAMSKTALLKIKNITVVNWFNDGVFAPKAGATYRFTSQEKSSGNYVFERLNTTNDDIVSIDSVTAVEVDS